MPTNVLHLSSENTWRGGEQQIAYLLAHSSTLGINNFVACKENSPFEKHCKDNHIPYISLPFKGMFDKKTIKGINAFARKNNIQLIHIHSSKSHGIAVLAHLFSFKKRPLILSRRVDFKLKSNFLSRWKYNYKGIKKIICVSHAIQKIITPSIKNTQKILTIHSGIDTHKFQNHLDSDILRKEYQLADDMVLIGNTSAIAPHKDYYTFIDTAKVLSKKNDKLVFFIIGSGPLENEIKSYVSEQGLKDKFIFTGFRNDIINVLPSLDIFLMTSNEEGLGTSVLDAFAAQVPVVSTNAGGIPEMVINNQTGFISDIGDSRALAEGIELLLKDKGFYQKIRNNASEKVKEFDYKITAEKTVAIYQELVKA